MRGSAEPRWSTRCSVANFFRLSLYADRVPVVPGHDPLRIYGTDPFLRDEGQLVRLCIYFTLGPDNAVELQHIEALEENMAGRR